MSEQTFSRGNEREAYVQARQERVRQREKDERYVRQAATYVEGAVRALHNESIGTSTDRFRRGYATEQFLWKIMSELHTLVPYLNYSDDEEDYYLQEDIRRDVAELHRALKRQEQVRKMSDTRGRTPEEQAIISAKVKEFEADG